MKKLITLLLVLTGYVMTASATTIYVKNNCSWGSLYLYIWGGSSPSATSWPGTQLTNTVKVDDTTYYIVEIGDNTNFIIHNNVAGNSDSNFNERAEYATSGVTDGAYYYFNYDNADWKDGVHCKWYKLVSETVYTYKFSVSKATGVTLSNIYLWKGSTKLVGAYPGASFTGGDYTYRTYTNHGTIGVKFNQGNGVVPQTCDMTADQGDNKYFISTITQYAGQAVKTNSSGYATAVSTGNLDFTTGIAYVAEDKGTWAQAHNVTGIMYENPFLIKGTASTTYCFAYGSGAALPCTNAFKAGTGGSLASEIGGKYNYILNGDSFYAANGQVVRTNKAYLQLSAQVPGTGTESRVLRFDGEDETTGIEAVDVNPETVKEGAREYYNLNGQRVMNPSKGLYIVNGKKVIIK